MHASALNIIHFYVVHSAIDADGICVVGPQRSMSMRGSIISFPESQNNILTDLDSHPPSSVHLESTPTTSRLSQYSVLHLYVETTSTIYTISSFPIYRHRVTRIQHDCRVLHFQAR